MSSRGCGVSIWMSISPEQSRQPSQVLTRTARASVTCRGGSDRHCPIAPENTRGGEMI